MYELDLQGGYLLNFLCSADGLGYKEVTANTVSEDYVIEEDLKRFCPKRPSIRAITVNCCASTGMTKRRCLPN